MYQHFNWVLALFKLMAGFINNLFNLMHRTVPLCPGPRCRYPPSGR